MDSLAVRVAKAHPTWVTGGGIEVAECDGCGAEIVAVDGYVNVGFGVHIAEETLKAAAAAASAAAAAAAVSDDAGNV